LGWVVNATPGGFTPGLGSTAGNYDCQMRSVGHGTRLQAYKPVMRQMNITNVIGMYGMNLLFQILILIMIMFRLRVASSIQFGAF
jgi:hypothetical protein